MDNEISKPNGPGESPSSEGRLLALKQEQLFHMGPLPAPADFEIYEKTVPGAGDRILRMAEQEQSFRHDVEKRRTNAVIEDAKEIRRLERYGQWLGFIIAIVALIIGYFLGVNNKTTCAVILFGGTIATLVAIFVTREKGKPRKNPSGTNHDSN